MRLNTDGSFDNTFTDRTFTPTDVTTTFPPIIDPQLGPPAYQPGFGVWSATPSLQDAYVQADGSIILTGHFTTFGNATARGMVRVDSNGVIDGSFNVGGGMQWTGTTETAASYPTVENIEPQSDGTFLITGTFEAFDGTLAPGIAHLNANGSVDTSFVAPVHRDKRSRTESAFRRQSDGSYLLSGPYKVGSETQPRSLIRLVNPQPGAVNISTRLGVGTDENVLIEGFIVQGPAGSSKKMLVRAIGPSLSKFGVSDVLQNPTLEIHDANSNTVATNNDWKITQIGGLITGDQFGDINNSGAAPTNELESAIIVPLAPGNYTAVVRGAGNSVGIGVVDAFDLDTGSSARLANIATRGLVQPDDKLMIAGFIVQNGAVKIVVRAIGPSLVDFGITNALPDTTVQLRNQQGAIVMENDDWKTGQPQELQSLGLQPSHNLEAALVATIPPGQYTAQVRGKGTDSGIGVVQVYFLQ
ncbi:MAG TPA: delta-60 repeat domain-containing protein [Chthoniobacterales bacterium]|nr:delta-60 repeat domain-containing protein [Chthoniobacterales bacterium]